MGDYRTASAQDTQTQAAIAGALLAYRTGPDQDVFTTNQITSTLVAYRSAADQDTATASSIAAALLSYYTIAQVDGLLAGKLGVTEAASAQIAVRFPDDGGADEVVAAIGEQILGPTDVSLSNWTVRPSSGCSVVLATHTAGVSVDPGGEPVEHRAHLQLDPGPRASLRLPLHGLQLRGVHVRQHLRPPVRQLRGRPGCLEHCQDVLHSASERGGFGAHFPGSTLTINNTANAGNFTTVGDVSTGTLTASGAATAASFAATGALTGATLTIAGAASAGPLDCDTFTATSGGVAWSAAM